MISVSAIIPVWNQRPEWLERAVNSVRAQDYDGFVELIVVDDGSDVPVLGAKVRHSRNLGIAAALNSGIAAMSSDWFAWLSSDDTWEPDKLSRQLAAARLANACLSCHSYRIVQPNGTGGQSYAPQWRDLDQQRREIARSCRINGSTVLIRRDVFDNVGRFDESYRYGQDWEFWCRSGQRYLWHAVGRVMGTRYDCPENLTSQIAGRQDMRARRDAEDAKIRSTYEYPSPGRI